MKLKNIMHFAVKFFLVIMVSAIITGCVSTRRWALDKTVGPAFNDIIESILDFRSLDLIKEGIAGDVILVTGLTELSPNSYKLLTATSFLYLAYGLLVENDNPEFAKNLYDTGRSYGFRALKLNKKIRKGLEEGKRLGKPLKTIEEVQKETGQGKVDFDKLPRLVDFADEEYIEALCWTGLNIGLKAILTMEDPSSLMGLPDAVALVQRSLMIDENFFFGIGKLFMAAYYAVVPEFIEAKAGPRNSEAMFQKANEVTEGKFLLIDVFKARYLAPLLKEPELFDKLLGKVLETDSSVLKGGYLLNEIAKQKAKIFNTNKQSYFY